MMGIVDTFKRIRIALWVVLILASLVVFGTESPVWRVVATAAVVTDIVLLLAVEIVIQERTKNGWD